MRGHGRRHNVVMTGSTVGVGIVVIALLWSGAISASGPQTAKPVRAALPPACLVMVVETLLGFNKYSGRARHRRSAA